RIKYRRELPWEDSAMSDLTELGQEAIAAVSKGVADGAPLVKCQLLASGFYEALRNVLRSADATWGVLLYCPDRLARSFRLQQLDLLVFEDIGGQYTRHSRAIFF